MKKTLVSIATASLIASTAMAADKGIDIVTTGQAVVYYETHNTDATGDKDIFDKSNSSANVAVQLDLAADLKNNFTFGSQLSYLGTAGIEKNVVSTEKQSGLYGTSTTDAVALSKIFIAKKIANSTVKVGRQELPKSLSPFAFSEGWNVLKNTFNAVLAVNTDIPDTTVVGAYVSGGTGMDLSSTGNLTPGAQLTNTKVTYPDAGSVQVDSTAYMLTVQNKSIPMTTVTLSYYDVAEISLETNTTSGATNSVTAHLEGASAIWADVKVADKSLPMGLKVGLQAGQISTESNSLEDTTAMGLKVGIKPMDALSFCLAYTSVDGDDSKDQVAIKNFGTGIKTPLFTQMVYNQNAIALDANTFVLKAVYDTGSYGKFVAQYGATTAGKSNLMGSEKDYNEFDLIYKIKAAGIQYFAAYINRSIDNGGDMGTDSGAEKDDRLRVWARYNF